MHDHHETDKEFDIAQLFLNSTPSRDENRVLTPTIITKSFASTPPLTISLGIDASPGCGGIAWPAAEVSWCQVFVKALFTSLQVLANYLVHKRTFCDNKCIIELGSGTGLVGLVAAVLSPSSEVWLTDQA
jgi:hypothetical protein